MTEERVEEVHPIVLDSIEAVFAIDAFQYALQYDHGPYATGEGNAMLPRNSVSVLWLQSVCVNRLAHHPAYAQVLCLDSISTRVLGPVVDGDTVHLTARYTDWVIDGVVQRDTVIDGAVDGCPVFQVSISHYLSEKAERHEHPQKDFWAEHPRTPGASPTP
jgi:hypothetical protein